METPSSGDRPGERFPSCHEMEAPSSPDLGGSPPCRATKTTSSVNLGDYDHAVTWKPKFPSLGAWFSSRWEIETARFPELGGFPRATKQKPQSSAGLGGSSSCRDMETQAPRTEATVSIVAGRGNPQVSRNWAVSVAPKKMGTLELHGLGRRFMSRRDMET